MPSIPTGTLARLYRMSIALATHAEASPLSGPLSLSGDVLAVLMSGRGVITGGSP